MSVERVMSKEKKKWKHGGLLKIVLQSNETCREETCIKRSWQFPGVSSQDTALVYHLDWPREKDLHMASSPTIYV